MSIDNQKKIYKIIKKLKNGITLEDILKLLLEQAKIKRCFWVAQYFARA